MSDEQANSSIVEMKSLLKDKGYNVLTESVDGKNQTRYVHMILEKAGKRYFAKINKRREQFFDITNEALSKQLPTGDDFEFIKSLEVIQLDEDRIILIYPFIAASPISSESNNFNSISVAPTDLNDFFKYTYTALSTLSEQQTYTYKDVGVTSPIHADHLVGWLASVNPTDTDVVEALQALAKKRHLQLPLVVSVSDAQPQNMFWDANLKKVYFFDMETIQHLPRGYDLAKLASSFYIVCSQVKVSTEWVDYVVHQLRTSTESTELIGQLHLMLLLAGVEYYSYFKKINDKNRVAGSINFIRWALRDFVKLVNDSGAK